MKRISLLLVCVAMSLSLASCDRSTSSGTFSLSFDWGEDGPPQAETYPEGLWVWGRVEKRDSDSQENWTRIGESPLVSFNFDGQTSLDLADIPNEDNLVIVVELSQEKSKEGLVEYFGESEPFSMKPGKHTDVRVAFQLNPTPAAQGSGDDDDDDDDDDPTSQTLTILEATGPKKDHVKTSVVTLSFVAQNATTALAANDIGFSSGVQSVSLDSLDHDGTRYLWSEWDLNAGLCEPGECQDGQRRVYIRFINDQGYESSVYDTQVELDTTPPGVSEQIAVSPMEANAGSTVYITVSPTEWLLEVPVLSVTPDDFSIGNVETDEETGNTIFTYLVDEQAVEGTEYRFTVDLVDYAENRSNQIALPGSLVVDRTAPRLVDQELPEQLRVGKNSEVVLSFMVSEALKNTPDVGLGRQAMTCAQTDEELTYRCSYTTPSDAATTESGFQTVRVQLVDRAGNTGSEALSDQIEFDFSPPKVVSNVVSPERAGLGDRISYTLRFDERLGETPTLQSDLPGEGFGESELSEEGLTYTWSRTVAEGELGLFDVRVSNVCDDLGNCTDEPQSLLALNVDAVAPSLESQELSPASGAWLSVGKTIMLSFTLNEGETLAPGYPKASLGGFPMEAQQAVEPFAYTFSYTTQGDEVPEDQDELAASVVVELLDQAGNSTTGNLGVVTFDFTNPSLDISSQPSPEERPAHSLERLAVTVTSSEQPGVEGIQLTAVNVDDESDSLPLIPGTPGIITTWTYVVQQGDEGTYRLQATGSDKAGNQAEPVTMTITIDGKVPQVRDYDLTPERVGPNSPFTLSFNVNDDLAGDPLVRFSNGIDATQTMVLTDAVEGWDYTFQGISPAEASAAFFTISVELEDEAANQGVYSLTTIEIDVVAPFLSNVEVSPSYVKPGARLQAVLSANEPLKQAPTLTALLAGADEPSISFTAQAADSSAVSYVYEATVPLNAPEGNYLFQDVQLEDVGSNVRTQPVAAEHGFEVNKTPPLVSEMAILVDDQVQVNPVFAHDTSFDISFQVDKELADLPAVRVGARTATHVEGSTYRYRFTTDSSQDAPGPIDITISATDQAGNVGYGRMVVTFDFIAPVILSSSASPDLVKQNATIRYEVNLNEALAEGSLPVLTATQNTGESWDFDFPPTLDAERKTITWQHTTQDGEDGEYTTSIHELCDIYGNCRQQVISGNLAGFAIDAINPEITNLRIVEATDPDSTTWQETETFSAQAGYNHIMVLFTISEQPKTVVVTIAGQDVSEACTHEGFDYLCPYTVVGDSASGVRNILLTITDLAGNQVGAERQVVVDLDPPQVVSSLASPEIVRLDNSLRYEFRTDEALSNTPSLLAQRQSDGASFPWDAFSSDVTLFSWSGTADEGESGQYDVRIDRLCDAYGNCSEDILSADTEALVGFEVDVDAPQITNFVSLEGSDPDPTNWPAATVFSAQPGYNRLVVRFTLNEEPEVVNVSLGVTNIVQSCERDGLDFSCSLTVQQDADGSGVRNILVSVTDEAGNPQSDDIQVSFDFDAPQIMASFASPDPAALGVKISYYLTVDEALGNESILTLDTQGVFAADDWVLLPDGGPSYRWWAWMNKNQAQLVDVAVTRFCDPYGNCDDQVAGVSFELDGLVPTVESLETYCGTSNTLCREFSAQTGFNQLSIRFSLSSEAGTITLDVGDESLDIDQDCVETSPLSYTCSMTVVDDGTEGGVQQITLVAQDAAGNSSFDSTTVSYDFKAPSLTGTPHFERCDYYSAARVASNDLYVKHGDDYQGGLCPFSACPGVLGPVAVHFATDESTLLTGDGVVVDGGDQLVEASCLNSNNDFTFYYIPGFVEGDRHIYASVADALGNEAQLDLGVLRIDFTPPSAPDTNTEDKIRYTRVPWGAMDTDGAKAYYLRGTSGSVSAGANVVAYDASDITQAAEIGRTRADDEGSFGRDIGGGGGFQISSADTPYVYVAEEDRAGNSSDLARVNDITWIATMGYKTQGSLLENPNVLYESGSMSQTVQTGSLREYWAPVNAAYNDAKASVYGEPQFTRVRKGTSIPYQRGGCGMAYNINAGTGLMFGGYWDVYAADMAYANDTWLWTGYGWIKQTPFTSPGTRTGHAMAFDPVRDRTVMFGGCNTGDECTNLMDETWTYDGEDWNLVCWPGCEYPTECTCTDSPSARKGATMSFHGNLGMLMLFGGEDENGVSDETWFFDGKTWHQDYPETTPPPRYHASMAYDAHRGYMVMGTGRDGSDVVFEDMWIYEEDNWVLQSYATDPYPATSPQSLYYDTEDQAVCTYTNYYGDPTTLGRYAWNGLDWEFTPVGKIFANEYLRSCEMYDSERKALVRFGGCRLSTCQDDSQAFNDTYLYYNNESWIDLDATNQPTARAEHVLTYKPDQAQLHLHGGRDNNRGGFLDDLFWDGFSWQGTSIRHDTGSWSHVMAWVGDAMIRFGGDQYASDAADTWYYTGSGWGFWAGPNGSPTEPDSSADAAMAWMEGQNYALYFGGDTNTAGLTWRVHWQDDGGPQWLTLTPATSPSARMAHKMVYCNVTDEENQSHPSIWMFGGQGVNDGPYYNDMWGWDGATWFDYSPESGPSARSDYSFICDKSRSKLYMIGGHRGESTLLRDIWQWDGAHWQELDPYIKPSFLYGADAAWYDDFSQGVLFGGRFEQYNQDTWVLEEGADKRPGVFFAVDFNASSAWDESEIKSLDARMIAGGTGYNNFSEPQPGAELLIRDNAGWVSLANDATLDTVYLWSTEQDAHWLNLASDVFQERIKRLFIGDRKQLLFRVSPKENNGNGSDWAHVDLQYIEAKLNYRLTCKQSGKETTDDSLCCSGMAYLNQCVSCLPNGAESDDPALCCSASTKNGLCNDNKLYLLSGPFNWATARAGCQSLGGDLVSINSAAEQAKIERMVPEDQNIWIGFNDISSEGNYVWVDGTTGGYTNWDPPNEPNNSGGNEDCADIWASHGYRWNDSTCTSSYPYALCENVNVD